MPEDNVVGQLLLADVVAGGAEEAEGAHESAFNWMFTHFPRALLGVTWMFIPPFWPVSQARKSEPP